ncbi:MAG: hypothetical protein P8048_06350 [Calditrichia bacterium]
MKSKNVLYPLFIFLIFLSCQNFMGGMTGDKNDNQSYMPLNVGDVRQIIMLEDSSTLLMSIVGTVRRSDGRVVYAMEWKWGFFEPDTLYYLNRNGYFLGTELDTTDGYHINSTVNPFGEQRLAKLYPEDGEIFTHTPGSSDNAFWICRKEQPLKTFCGIFSDVFSFNLYDTLNFQPFMETFYGKGYGYLGTSAFSSPEPDFLASYISVGNKTVGSIWPTKNPGGLMKNSENRKNLSEVLNRIFYPGIDPLGKR